MHSDPTPLPPQCPADCSSNLDEEVRHQMSHRSVQSNVIPTTSQYQSERVERLTWAGLGDLGSGVAGVKVKKGVVQITSLTGL